MTEEERLMLIESLTQANPMSLSSDTFKNIYQEYPKFWQAQQNTDPVQCSFVMSNANGTGGNNLQTIKSFAAMCRPIKEGVNITPPCLFSLSITGGHRNLPVTYCSSFSVGMLGGRGGDGPEGYEINVAFQPLLIETADMWA